jgi:dipeptidyl aminopeptidase/acylaminoacyl peptidase
MSNMRKYCLAIAVIVLCWHSDIARGQFAPEDLHRLRQVGDAQISPDGERIVYAVQHSDQMGRPDSRLAVMTVATGASLPVGGADDHGSSPRWSPDGRKIAYLGSLNGESGLIVVSSDGTEPTFVASVQGTNHALPSTGDALAWSPDGTRIAYVSASLGPESQNANGDPAVITRYLYKPTASEGMTRFDDNRRVHIYVVDLATKKIDQLTSGNYYEHSLEWSPNGKEILFVSNHETKTDQVFNYDVFSIRVEDRVVRRLTDTKSAEYRPRWSPDGKEIVYLATTRPLTSSETTMEDTHVWLMDANGENRRDIGGSLDQRENSPEWAPDGKSVYFTGQTHGEVKLYNLPLDSMKPQAVPGIGSSTSVSAFSISRNGRLAYTLHTKDDLPELYLWADDSSKELTDLNRNVITATSIAPVVSFTFPSVDGLPVEAFLTKPLNLESGKKYPMIVMMHGGPHGQQGSGFDFKAQVYASHGYAALMVNYRGSTGYGQKFTDTIFRDQDGKEAQDVLWGVDAVLKQNPWIDGNRLGLEGGSYGGQLTNWIVTQTTRFKAAIPTAGISNLISVNYMQYYHDYIPVEFGGYPHTDHIMDLLWERSPLRYVANVTTPVLFIHGENDNDVPIAEDEQFYIALKDVGVETVMLRYPREGHGLREVGHQIDGMNRSMAWYDEHFAPH